MIVTGRLRRSVQGRIEGNGVVFSSDTPYASIHNEGFNGTQQVRSYVARSRKSGRSYTVPAHSRHMVMPQRQFVGGHRRVTQAVEAIVRTNLYDYFDQLAKRIQK
jgi:phage gpG-like protein